MVRARARQVPCISMLFNTSMSPATLYLYISWTVLFTFFLYLRFLYCIICASLSSLTYHVTMMGWLRNRPFPSPTSSSNSPATSLPQPRLKRASSSFTDSLTSFDFRKKAHSEGEAENIDLVPLEPSSPCRVSRSHSPSELPQSEEVIVEHVTPPPSPPRSVHEVLPSPSKTKNAIAFFERKVSVSSGTAAHSPSTSASPLSLTYISAAKAERKLRKSTSIARPASVTKSDSEDSMASLVSMLNQPNITANADSEQWPTPVHHEPNCAPTTILSPSWMRSPRSVRSTGQKSESTSSLRTVDTNRNVKDDEPSELPSTKKTTLRRVARSGHFRSWTVSDRDLSEAQSEGRTGLFHRSFRLSRRSQSHSASELDNSAVAALPCFMTSSDDFMNDRAVQDLHMASPGPSMSAFIDGSYSTNQSFSAPGDGPNQSSAQMPLTTGDPSFASQYQAPQKRPAQSTRPVSSRSGLPLSSRSLNKAAATSALSLFPHPPEMQISDIPSRNLVQIGEAVVFPSPKSPPPSFLDTMSFAWDVPRTASPASTASSSRRHSMQRVPVKTDFAAHFPRSVSPAWEARPQSFSAIIIDPGLSHSAIDQSHSRSSIATDYATRFPRSISPQGVPGLIVDVSQKQLPFEPSFSPRSSSLDSDTPLYSLPIEPSFGRKRSNSKFEPHADLPPISEVRKAGALESEEQADLGADGHKSSGNIHAYDPPISSPHEEGRPIEAEEKPRRKEKNEKKNGKKLKKKRQHEKTHKIVRYSRRFFLRKKVLNLLLGRQLGGAVADGLRAITCLPVGTDSLDLAVVAVPGGVRSPLHAGAVFPLAVVVGRKELDSEERNGRLHFSQSRSCVALTAPDLDDGQEGSWRRERHLSLDDLSNAIRHVDYR